jgi:hypothetical protein
VVGDVQDAAQAIDQPALVGEVGARAGDRLELDEGAEAGHEVEGDAHALPEQEPPLLLDHGHHPRTPPASRAWRPRL